MDDTPDQETPPKDFNKLDLSQLQGFSFGTQWTQDKAAAGDRREPGERPHREGPGGAPERRDRRAFRKPTDEGRPAERGSGAGEPGGARRDPAERGPRREFQGGARHSFPGRGEQPEQRGPYESPYYSATFYPEDTSFNALAKTIRSSCRTIELFEIARTVVDKLDRFVVVLTRKSAPSEAAAQAATEKQPIYISVPDGLPFESEEAALSHVLGNHLGIFFDMAEVEVEPPKGNFQVINRCTITGELLGPPNYHRYAQIVQQHFASKISHMSLEAYRSRIETVREPEVVAQWLEKMKKTTRYTWKQPGQKQSTPAAAIPEATAEPTMEAPTEATTDTPTEAAPAPVAEIAVAPAELAFDNFEDARSHLLANARARMVKPVETARFHGKIAESLPPGEIRRATEGALERQRRFPLDTANALRGRLRREHFTIFKKGSKGVSYVCAVKRKFRVPGQTFAESIAALISFIEAHPMVRASELPRKFLELELPVAAKPASAPPVAVAGQPVPETAAPAATEPVLTPEHRTKFIRMQGDLRWLVTEGYVTEFIDGRLFAAPPMVEARKREVEAEDNDPENFPEAPADSRPPIPLPPSLAVEAANVETSAAPEEKSPEILPADEPASPPNENSGEPPAASPVA